MSILCIYCNLIGLGIVEKIRKKLKHVHQKGHQYIHSFIRPEDQKRLTS
jgi:hypothetical protein